MLTHTENEVAPVPHANDSAALVDLLIQRIQTAKDIMNLKEAADFLLLHPMSLRRLMTNPKGPQVPGRKMGGEWRFSRTGLIRWISNKDFESNKTNDEGKGKSWYSGDSIRVRAKR